MRICHFAHRAPSLPVCLLSHASLPCHSLGGVSQGALTSASKDTGTGPKTGDRPLTWAHDGARWPMVPVHPMASAPMMPRMSPVPHCSPFRFCEPLQLPVNAFFAQASQNLKCDLKTKSHRQHRNPRQRVDLQVKEPQEKEGHIEVAFWPRGC